MNIWKIGCPNIVAVCCAGGVRYPCDRNRFPNGVFDTMATCKACISALQQLHGHTSTVESVTFDSEEEMVVSGSSGGTIKVWDLNSERSMAPWHS